MRGSMRWEDSIKKSGRPAGSRTASAADNAIKHKAIPKKDFASKMSSEQRQSLKRAITHRAEYLQSCWRPEALRLPALALPVSDARSESAVVQLYKCVWDWQDECCEVMSGFRNQEPPPPYDFSSFDIAFSGIARCDALRGPYYSACVAALQARTKVTSGSA